MIAVKHHPDHTYFAISLDGEPIGRLDYRLSEGNAIITHTEIDPEHRGQDYAAVLTKESLAVLKQNYKIVPDCPYVVAYLIRHPKER